MLNGTAVSSGGPPAAAAFASSENGVTSKRKRRPAGTPDPDAEVVSLSPKTLLESDQYVCEICQQGFQRDQNLQMHRRRHKVPWKLLKRPETQDQVKKKVFVCPEPTCLHHHPCHALGDLVGIKKHFRRKHSNHKQWVCDKCSKGYAVHSDFKAHLKTCGTRGHSCDCGRVFSRVESFIEHQDACNLRQVRSEPQPQNWFSPSVSGSSPCGEFNTTVPLRGFPIMSNPYRNNLNIDFASTSGQQLGEHHHDLDLHLSSPNSVQNCANFLKLSIGSCVGGEKNESSNNNNNNEHKQLVEVAMAEKAYAEEARREAKIQIEMAEVEFANAKMIRQQAQAELEKARILKEEASRKMSSTIMEITCQTCTQHYHYHITNSAATSILMPPEETSLAISYMSSATTEGEGDLE